MPESEALIWLTFSRPLTLRISKVVVRGTLSIAELAEKLLLLAHISKTMINFAP